MKKGYIVSGHFGVIGFFSNKRNVWKRLESETRTFQKWCDSSAGKYLSDSLGSRCRVWLTKSENKAYINYANGSEYRAYDIRPVTVDQCSI